jgi:spore maturation protein CgeB
LPEREQALRIFTAVRHCIDPRFYYGELWSGNFYPALRQLGHEIVESQVDLLAGSRFMYLAGNFTAEQNEIRAKITQQIIDEVRRAHDEKPVDLFLSYFYNSHFDPAGFDEIKRLGIPTVNFYCNSIYQFPLVAEIARKVGFSWHSERNARALYLKVNANPVWVQMAADPGTYHPVESSARQPKACFVGQRYCDRDRWLAGLVREKIPADIYGSGWLSKEYHNHPNGNSNAEGKPHPSSARAYLAAMGQNLKANGLLGGSLRTLRQGIYAKQTRKLLPQLQPHVKGKAGALSEVFSQYEVVLNFSNVWADGRSGSQLIPHVRLRDFEAPMCRSCYLTGHSEEIEGFYKVGHEIDTYGSERELVEKLRFYLGHSSAAEKLREAGYQRAKRDHTWVQRFQQLFRLTGLSKQVAALR